MTLSHIKKFGRINIYNSQRIPLVFQFQQNFDHEAKYFLSEIFSVRRFFLNIFSVANKNFVKNEFFSVVERDV